MPSSQQAEHKTTPQYLSIPQIPISLNTTIHSFIHPTPFPLTHLFILKPTYFKSHSSNQSHGTNMSQIPPLPSTLPPTPTFFCEALEPPSPHLGNVHSKRTVYPRAGQAKESAQVDTSPSRPSGSTIRTQPVAFSLQQIAQDLFVPLVLLPAHFRFPVAGHFGAGVTL